MKRFKAIREPVALIDQVFQCLKCLDTMVRIGVHSEFKTFACMRNGCEQYNQMIKIPNTYALGHRLL